MANAKQVALLKRSVVDWNKSRKKDPEVIPDLAGAHPSGANLGGPNTDLFLANLDVANLSGTYLLGTDLGVADLVRVDLRGLGGADLGGAYLRAADLSGAYLGGAFFGGAHLHGARISGAIVAWTVFGGVDLGVVEGLETVDHRAPSMTGVDTILKSGGKIPDGFLRGCGVDPLIQKMLMGDTQSKTDAFYAWITRRHSPLQRCFISY
jgi:hypothetical protein